MENKENKKQVTKASLANTLAIALIVCVITGSISYSHIMDAKTVIASDEELAGHYLAAFGSGMMSFVIFCFAVRTLLILSGKLKVKNLEII